MPAKRNRKNSGAANEGKETSRGRGLSSSAAQRDPFASIPDDRLYKFTKDEIVWAKMKFFSAWPAKVTMNFTVKGENYKKKKLAPPKQQVEFFDNPPTLGEIHHNQIFKFVDNYKKFALTSNKKLQLGIRQAKEQIPQEERERIKQIENEIKLIFSEDEQEEMYEQQSIEIQEGDHSDENHSLKVKGVQQVDDEVEDNTERIIEIATIEQGLNQFNDQVQVMNNDERLEVKDCVVPYGAVFNPEQEMINQREGDDVNMDAERSQIDSKQENEFKIPESNPVALKNRARKTSEQIKADTGKLVCESPSSDKSKEIGLQKALSPDEISKFKIEEIDCNVKGNEDVKDLNVEQNIKEDNQDNRDDDKNSEGKKPEVITDIPKLTNQDFQTSPISSKPKRTPKPTHVYEIFVSQQAHNKRVKKQNEKDREQKRLLRDKKVNDLQQGLPSLEKSKSKRSAKATPDMTELNNEDILYESLGAGDKRQNCRNTRKSSMFKESNQGDEPNQLEEVNLSLSMKKSLDRSKKKVVQQANAQQIGTSVASAAPSVGGLNLQNENSSAHQAYQHNISASSQRSFQKVVKKDKVQKMKEIKKYFENFFKEIKELNKEILQLNDDVQQMPIQKTKQEKDLEADTLQKLIKKAYHQIRLNSKHIDAKLSEVFREYNELSLMHDSKLGHALKDMQQFLEYYQSSDETIQSILGKLDMIIDIQLKRMNIEIFGENSIDCDLIRKHIKGGVESPNRPSFGQTSENILGVRKQASQNERTMTAGNPQQNHQVAESPQEADTAQEDDGEKHSGQDTSKKTSHQKKTKVGKGPSKGELPILGQRIATASKKPDGKKLKLNKNALSRPGAGHGASSGTFGPGLLPNPAMAGNLVQNPMNMTQQNHPSIFNNLIQSRLKMQMHMVQQKQLMQLYMQQMQPFPNMQGYQNQLQDFQLQQLANQQINQHHNGGQAPSQSLNLTILNNGQNFMNLPGAPASNVPNLSSIAQNQTHAQQLTNIMLQNQPQQMGGEQNNMGNNGSNPDTSIAQGQQNQHSEESDDHAQMKYNRTYMQDKQTDQQRFSNDQRGTQSKSSGQVQQQYMQDVSRAEIKASLEFHNQMDQQELKKMKYYLSSNQTNQRVSQPIVSNPSTALKANTSSSNFNKKVIIPKISSRNQINKP